MSGRAIEAAGDVDILMLDKTGTITLGNRRADSFIPVDGNSEQELADAAQLSSLADETPEGRSVVVLAKEKFGIRERSLSEKGMVFVLFTAVTRMSGVNYDGCEIRKGAADAIKEYVIKGGGIYSPECDEIVKKIASKGGTPLVVAKNHIVLGVIYLKDIIKDGVKEKFADLRKMGIKTIMITGDNPLTAAAIAAEAGVDDFLAEATPEGKLNMIRDFQKKGHLVAMTGDGTNDAPALAQADVAVAMNSGTQAAKEAGNMVDLDSSPTIIAGCGRLGASIAGELSEQKKDVMIIDRDKTAFRKLPMSFGGLTLAASVTDLERLKTAEIDKATVFIAVTDDDCTNICASQIAKKVFHIEKVVARIYDEEKIPLVTGMEIDTICPTKLSENGIFEYLFRAGRSGTALTVKLYRAFLQYVGGLGFVMTMLLFVQGKDSAVLYQAEGHPDRLMPDIGKTAKVIGTMYGFFLLIGTVFYTILGMSFFDLHTRRNIRRF